VQVAVAVTFPTSAGERATGEPVGCGDRAGGRGLAGDALDLDHGRHLLVAGGERFSPLNNSMPTTCERWPPSNNVAAGPDPKVSPHHSLIRFGVISGRRCISPYCPQSKQVWNPRRWSPALPSSQPPDAWPIRLVISALRPHAETALVCLLHAMVSVGAVSGGHTAGNGKALRRAIRRSAREGGPGCEFSLSRRRNHLASRRFRRRRLPTVLAVSGSMVQNRKSLTRSGNSKLLELRSQRQADATNPSEWTQAGLARKVGASVRSVKAWEAGDTMPRLFYRRRLAKALGVSVSDLGF